MLHSCLQALADSSAWELMDGVGPGPGFSQGGLSPPGLCSKKDAESCLSALASGFLLPDSLQHLGAGSGGGAVAG